MTFPRPAEVLSNQVRSFISDISIACSKSNNTKYLKTPAESAKMSKNQPDDIEHARTIRQR